MTFANLFSNKQEQKCLRQRLRNNSTKAEKVLWQELKNNKLGYKFRRQFQIGYYIVDFYCYKLRLIIELDGPVHGEELQRKHDVKRDKWLRSMGFYLLRYQNEQVLFERERVLNHILKVCQMLNKNKLH